MCILCDKELCTACVQIYKFAAMQRRTCTIYICCILFNVHVQIRTHTRTHYIVAMRHYRFMLWNQNIKLKSSYAHIYIYVYNVRAFHVAYSNSFRVWMFKRLFSVRKSWLTTFWMNRVYNMNRIHNPLRASVRIFLYSSAIVCFIVSTFSFGNVFLHFVNIQNLHEHAKTKLK